MILPDRQSLDSRPDRQESLIVGSDQLIVFWEGRSAYCKGFASQERDSQTQIGNGLSKKMMAFFFLVLSFFSVNVFDPAGAQANLSRDAAGIRATALRLVDSAYLERFYVAEAFTNDLAHLLSSFLGILIEEDLDNMTFLSLEP